MPGVGCQVSAVREGNRCQVSGGTVSALEMLKMKEPPGMCMKTRGVVTKCQAIYTVFAGKCTNSAIIDNNRSGFWSELAQVTR